MLYVVAALIFVALFFDYINGFHDAANSIATVVSTRVLSPGKAVIWAAVFNFIAAFTFGTAVAKTVGSGLVDIRVVTFAVIFAGLVGAIVWDLITWYYGLPSRSARSRAAGASFTRWDRRSPSCSRSADSVRRPPAPFHSSLPRTSGCPSAPRTRSRARSSASDRS